MELIYCKLKLNTILLIKDNILTKKRQITTLHRCFYNSFPFFNIKFVTCSPLSPTKIDYFCKHNIFMQVDFSKIDPKKNIIIKGAEVHNLKVWML
jgi:hypothetical protein